MAAPNAAAVAALIWSKNPEWTRNQVAAQLMGTADNIDEANPNRINELGSGRVNSYRSLSETIAPPQLRGLLISGIRAGVDRLILETGSVFDPNSVEDAEYKLSIVDNDNNRIDYTLTLESNYRIASNRIELRLDRPLVSGVATFIAPNTLKRSFRYSNRWQSKWQIGWKILPNAGHNEQFGDTIGPY